MALRKLTIDSKSQLDTMAKDSVVIEGAEVTPEVVLASSEEFGIELDYMEYATNELARLAYVCSDKYGSDMCTGGTPIESSHASPSWLPAYAFDDNSETGWATGESGAGVNGVSYIGYDFGEGVARHIRRISIDNLAAINTVASILFQYSDNGSDWTVAETISLVVDDSTHTYDVSATGAHRCWRALANSGLAGVGSWVVMEFDMYQLVLQVYNNLLVHIILFLSYKVPYMICCFFDFLQCFLVSIPMCCYKLKYSI